MARTRTRFTEDFKRDAVNLLLSSGKTMDAVARELGIGPSNLGRWRDQYVNESEEPKKAPETPAEKMRRLEAENRKLRQENAVMKEQQEVLKKAMGIVSTR